MYRKLRLSTKLADVAVPQRRAEDGMSSAAQGDGAFRQGLVKLMPLINSLSYSLCKNRELARDLAQDTFCKAWQARASFRSGSNMKAWLCTILRNFYTSHYRRAWRQVDYDQAAFEEVAGPEDAQDWAVLAADAARCLDILPPDQRKALILVGVGGYSHSEAAAICGCADGTMKSRLSRARKTTATALSGAVPLSGPRPAIGTAASKLLRELQDAMPRC